MLVQIGADAHPVRPPCTFTTYTEIVTDFADERAGSSLHIRRACAACLTSRAPAAMDIVSDRYEVGSIRLPSSA
jgi:hypothetical protein